MLINLFGKTALERAISKAIGFNIGFKSINIDFDRYVVNIKEFCIFRHGSFRDKIFYAEQCALTIDKNVFKKYKRAYIKELAIEKGVLNLVKDKKGAFNLGCNYGEEVVFGESLAYADTAASAQFYNFASNIEKVTIKDSSIKFSDYHVSGGPFSISFYGFNLDFHVEPGPSAASEPINAECRFAFKVRNPNYRQDSEVTFNGRFLIYPERVNIDTVINTTNVDLMQFLPYFKTYTPFSFRSGLFSSNTRWQMRDEMVNSPTVMVFHNLKLSVDPQKKNTQFLKVSINKLVPYLTTGQGGIVFDFVLSGPVNNLKGEIGPQLKNAIGLAVIKEIGNILQQFQKK